MTTDKTAVPLRSPEILIEGQRHIRDQHSATTGPFATMIGNKA
jgi:hypothetical protein